MDIWTKTQTDGTVYKKREGRKEGMKGERQGRGQIISNAL